MSDRAPGMPETGLRVKRRNAWLAAFLSLLMPGLGQLYAGRWRRALGFMIAVVLIDLSMGLGVWSFATLLVQPGGFWLAFGAGLLVILFHIVAITDAALVARRAPLGPLAAYQRWYVYIALLCLWTVVGLYDSWSPSSGTESYSIPSGSMLPTMEIGDFVIGVRIAGETALPDRGAIVTHTEPGSGDTYIRRLVGLPGDTVEMRDGILVLNGSPVALEPAGKYRGGYPMLQETLPGGASYFVLDTGDSPLDNMPTLTVPSGYVFLLGDNRDNSRDNRVGGPVPIASLEAKVLYVYWSADLGRIGRRLD